MPCICLFVRLLDCRIVTQPRHSVGILKKKKKILGGGGGVVGLRGGLVLEVRPSLVRTFPRL